MRNILAIDDEPSILTALELSLEDSFKIYTTVSVPEGLNLIKLNKIDLVLLDQYLGEYDGIDVLRSIKKSFPDVIVIAMTAYGSIDSSIKAMQMGAYYYITKPLDITGLKILINKALDYRSLSYEVEFLKKKLSFENNDLRIIAKSKKMNDIFLLVEKIKDLDINILITGESGTGKDLIAKGIHSSSKRSDRPMEIVNCAAIPHNLLESELFGYEKGAFTGASARFKGKFLLANGGTLFLDEIGELDIALQAKLLRVIQEKKITPLGGEKSIPVDFRLIVATNRNLKDQVEEGNFREDLFFRLNVVNIDIPPLRDRIEDVPGLVSFFIEKYNNKFGKAISEVSSEAISLLENYNYPGNIRELENIIERAVALTSKSNINVQDLPPQILKTSNFKEGQDWIAIKLGLPLEEVIKDYTLNLYNLCDKNKRKTAKILGISERSLYTKLSSYDYEKK